MKNLLNAQNALIISKFQLMVIHVNLKTVTIGQYLMSILISFNKLNVLTVLMALATGKQLMGASLAKTTSH